MFAISLDSNASSIINKSVLINPVICENTILNNKFNDYKIELIQNYPCNSKLELEIKECKYMKLYPLSVNYSRRSIYSTINQYNSVKYDYNKQLDYIKNSLKLD